MNIERILISRITALHKGENRQHLVTAFSLYQTLLRIPIYFFCISSMY